MTVTLGAPAITAAIANKGRDPDGSFWIDLRLANGGSGHARNVRLTSLAFRTLNGLGTVTYDAARSGPLPLQFGAIDVGETRTVRLYLNVPPTVARFSITENGVLQNVIGGNYSFSFGQAVFP